MNRRDPSDQNQKKWFYHINKRNVGPCTLQEMEKKIQERVILAKTFVWCKGMDNWKSAKDVEPFRNFLSVTDPSIPPLPNTESPSSVEEKPLRPDLSALNELNPQEINDETGLRKVSYVAAKEVARVKVILLKEQLGSGLLENKKKLSGILALVFVLMGGAGYFFQSGGLGSLKQGIARLRSPLPVLPDLSDEIYAELKAAATSDWSQGAQVSVAIDSKRIIYVAGNLPDGVHLKLGLNGLGGNTAVKLQLSLLMNHKLAISDGLKQAGAVPAGDYDVSVTEEEGGQSPEVQTQLADKKIVFRQKIRLD